MSVSWLLLHIRWQRLTDFFRLIGFHALFAFVVHRIPLQIIYIALNVLEIEDTRYQYGLLLMGTMLITFCLCWWRQRYGGMLRPSARAVEAGHATGRLPSPRAT